MCVPSVQTMGAITSLQYVTHLTLVDADVQQYQGRKKFNGYRLLKPIAINCEQILINLQSIRM